MRTLSVRLFFRTEIRTYGNTNIKKRLIRFCGTDESRTDKVRRINNSHTWKLSLKEYHQVMWTAVGKKIIFSDFEFQIDVRNCHNQLSDYD